MKKVAAILYSIPIHKYALIFLLLAAYCVRSFGRDWDGLTHMHPDERMLMMVTDRITFPDKLYPDFFNYGSLPIYALKLLIQFMSSQSGSTYFSTTYGPNLLSAGRFLSTIFDIGTMIMIYMIVRFAGGKKYTHLALVAAAIYAMMFFPIQNSHFFVVDVFVTFFLTAATLFMLLYLKKRSYIFLVLQAAFIGFSVASKFTAVLFVPGSIVTILAAQYLWQKKSLLYKLVNAVALSVVWSVVTFGAFFLTMPYAVLPPSGILTKFAVETGKSEMAFSKVALEQTVSEFASFFAIDQYPTIRFLRDMKEQTRMNSSPYAFPYTLQYAGTTPYIYYLKNIVIWGAGPFVSLWILAGVALFVKKNFENMTKGYYKKAESKKSVIPNLFRDLSDYCIKGICSINAETIFIYIFFFSTFFLFFLIIGKSAVKFMRYMLPIYPMLAIVAAYGLINFGHLFSKRYKRLVRMAKITSVIFAIAWTISFLNIYTTKNTRAAATDWILANIPQGSVLGVEHWDDRVPIHSGERYVYEEIPMYERPDNTQKWQMINSKLDKIDYYILASNRLYAPLQRLTDCKAHKDSCYTLASKFYADLLAGKTKFKKVAEFTSYPRLGPLEIPDDEADESFTVYDHPKVMVFKKSDQK